MAFALLFKLFYISKKHDIGMIQRSSLPCFGCKYLEHYYYSTGNMDCKLKGHITLGFGDDMGCENYESNN